MDSLKRGVQTARVLVVGLVVVLVVLGLALIVFLLGNPRQGRTDQNPVNVLAASTDACVSCHERATPGIVEQFGHSTMAGAKVTCQNCHEVAADAPGAEAHEGTYVLATPTTAKCQQCHQVEVAQFYQSRHSLPAYVAWAGSKNLSPQMMQMYQSIPEGQFSPNKERNVIGAMEGAQITRFACETCHNIGRPAVDGSVGQCQKCHLRHEFSLEQARKPETCNNCHIGPDHPQFEIYSESPHGVAYQTQGKDWNWSADPGTLTAKDFPAPTCAICHFSGFGTAGTTHDTGDRLTWFLFSAVSERRPSWQDNLVRMQGVCLQCHNKNFVDSFYQGADAATAKVNDWVNESNKIQDQMKQAGAPIDPAFNQPIDFTAFELWHHWGRTAKFGTWMQGPDYTQWHGAYEILKALADLRSYAADVAKQGAGSGK